MAEPREEPMPDVDQDAAVEAEDWIEQIYMDASSSPLKYSQYFRGATRKEDLTIHLLNLANDIIKRVFPDAPCDKSQLNESWKAERHYKAQCAQYLYYR